jgi:hypothetical protein
MMLEPMTDSVVAFKAGAPVYVVISKAESTCLMWISWHYRIFDVTNEVTHKLRSV